MISSFVILVTRSRLQNCHLCDAPLWWNYKCTIIDIWNLHHHFLPFFLHLNWIFSNVTWDPLPKMYSFNSVLAGTFDKHYWCLLCLVFPFSNHSLSFVIYSVPLQTLFGGGWNWQYFVSHVKKKKKTTTKELINSLFSKIFCVQFLLP